MSDLPLRKRFFINGEPAPALELHTPYLKPAYKLLDQVRAQMGDTLQQLVQRVDLEDGARLEAHVRHGQAEIWIDIPRSVGVTQQDEDEEFRPYLWVGARVAWERMPPFADYGAFYEALGGNLRDVCQLHVWEPGGNGIIGTAPLLPIEFLQGGTTLEAVAVVAAMQGVVPEHAQVAAEMGYVTHTPPAGSGLDPIELGYYKFLYTRHMMYMTAWGFSPLVTLDSASGTLPTYDPRHIYDPLEGDDQWTKRQINIELDTEANETGDTSAFATTWPLWDSVVVLDPYFGKVGPTDKRGFLPVKEVAEREELPFGRSQVIAGNYVIKVGAKGFTCPAQNIEIDLEVRVSKNPHMKRRRYQITVPNAGYAARLITPYGWQWPQGESWPCPEYSGTNPHSHNWWQGAVLANVRQGTQQRVELLVPSHGFEPAQFEFGCPPNTGGTVPGNELYIGWVMTASGAWLPYAAEVTARIVLQGAWGFPGEYPLDAYRASQGLPPILSEGYGAEVKAAAQRDIVDQPIMGGLYWFDKQNMRFVKVPGDIFPAANADVWGEPYYTAANAAGNNMLYWVVGWTNGYYLANGSTTCLAA